MTRHAWMIVLGGPLMEVMMREVADRVTGLRVPRTGHWIAEENPAGFCDALVAWLGYLAPP